MQRRLTPAERQAVHAYRNAEIYLAQNGISNFSDRISEMLYHNTSDGLPYVEPPLTDEDARQRPWVMVRDHEMSSWHGPVVFVDKLPNGRYVCRTRCQKGVNVWFECRRATLAELVGAGLEVAE